MSKIDKATVVVRPFFTKTGAPVDLFASVGTECLIKTIDELVNDYQQLLSDGKLIDDFDNGITWQLYGNIVDGFNYRIFDAMFYVDAIEDMLVHNTEMPSGLPYTVDGVTINSVNQSVLFVNMNYPVYNGIYKPVNDTDQWVRHPLFNEANKQNFIGTKFSAINGTKNKGSIWNIINHGDYTVHNIGESGTIVDNLYFAPIDTRSYFITEE